MRIPGVSAKSARAEEPGASGNPEISGGVSDNQEIADSVSYNPAAPEEVQKNAEIENENENFGRRR